LRENVSAGKLVEKSAAGWDENVFSTLLKVQLGELNHPVYCKGSTITLDPEPSRLQNTSLPLKNFRANSAISDKNEGTLLM
jgi:hypothetical protein